MSDVLGALRSESRLAGVPDGVIESRLAPPPVQPVEIDAFEGALHDLEPADGRARDAHNRCKAGFRVVRGMLSGSNDQCRQDMYELLGSKQWLILLRQLITNYRRELHFLPADGLPADWSILSEHSLVLFRYPLTAPVAIFDAAQDVSIANWSAWIKEVEPQLPLAAAFLDVRPLKGIALRKDFLADLLTRYAGLYLRIGSPDFLPKTIDQYVKDMDLR